MYACSKYISGCAIQEKEINSKLQPEKDYTWTATYILQYFFNILSSSFLAWLPFPMGSCLHLNLKLGAE